METEPAVRAVTVPAGDTLATAGLDDVHDTARPVSTLPFASLATAVACVVWPVYKLGDPSVTLTVATGAVFGTDTVSGAEPLFESTVA